LKEGLSDVLAGGTFEETSPANLLPGASSESLVTRCMKVVMAWEGLLALCLVVCWFKAGTPEACRSPLLFFEIACALWMGWAAGG
jgi:hypothetical protein